MKPSFFNTLKVTLLAVLAVTLVACSAGATTSNASEASVASVASSASTVVSAPASATTASSATVTKLNLNTASAAEFAAVPNAGQRMAREFAEYRPYTTILQFRKEIGKYVDAQTVAAYEQYVYVPVDINQADTETLKQIPGVDDTVAADLISARPYASADAFLAKLATHLSADQVTVAKSYLAS